MRLNEAEVAGRQLLRLADAMVEADGEDPEETEADGVMVPQCYVIVRSRGGITFQRCGGGHRVIRRIERRSY